MLKYKFDLQTFAEGGESGAAGEGTGVATGVSDSDSDIQVPSFIPEKKKALYIKHAKEARSASAAGESKAHPEDPTAADPTATAQKADKKATFAELMESEEYKAEREAYMHDAFKRRFSKYDGIEKENAEAKELLSMLGEKFKIPADSKTYMEDLRKAISGDESDKKVQEYMKKHDVEEEEARRVVQMENDLAEKARTERIKKMAEQQMQERKAQDERMSALKDSAARTKEEYPDFDLAAEMKSEKFLRMLAATGGDTTAAYVASHHRELMSSTAKKATESASVQIANAVAANQKRPSEGAIGTAPSSVAEVNVKNMTREERRAAFYSMTKKRG